MTHHRLTPLALGIAAGLALAAVGRAAEPPAQPPERASRVTFVHSAGYEQTQLVAPGEWVPRSCYLAMPYRGGKVLRFERKDPRGVVSLGGSLVSIDGGPLQPAWITLDRRDDEMKDLRRALAQGARGFNVICHPETLPKLPPLPRGRNIALAVISTVDPAPLAQQPGISALSLRVKEGHGLDVLGALPELTSLRLHCAKDCDLAPLGRATKLAWLRLTGARDLASLPAMPALRGLRVMAMDPVPDLRPIARLRGLTVLHLSCGAKLTDIAPSPRSRSSRHSASPAQASQISRRWPA